MEHKKRFEEILIYALKNRVSDIHFNIVNGTIYIKMRSVVSLIDINSKKEDLNLINELSYIAQLDLTDKIHPQSGAFSYLFYKKTLYFRFSVLYVDSVASFNLRILYQNVIKDNLSLFDWQNKMFEKAIKNDSGFILFSGPTGSGKTTSAYGLLRKIKDKEIYTIEDPIEMKMENAIQLQVNALKGITYESGIKALMRHDPDIILIGEIRDEKEAHMAIRAALTGHLVISTVHAKSASGAINRLLDLNVNEYDLFETLLLLTNQRLITKDNERECLYEIMDSNEIEYYRKYQKNSKDFFSIEKQKEIIL